MRVQIEGCTCDRCGEGAQWDETPEGKDLRAKWAALKAWTLGGVDLAGESDGPPADLCPDCVRELERWLKGAKLREPIRPARGAKL